MDSFVRASHPTELCRARTLQVGATQARQGDSHLCRLKAGGYEGLKHTLRLVGLLCTRAGGNKRVVRDHIGGQTLLKQAHQTASPVNVGSISVRMQHCVEGNRVDGNLR